VVPALNEASGIGRMLDRLAGARDRGAEVIVVDGESSDATREIARPLADAVIISPPGRAVQMNAGALVATGDLLLFLHADSTVPADVDHEILNAVGTREFAWGRFDVTIEGRAPILRLVSTMMNLRSRLSGIATGDQGIFVTRALFERIGRYPVIPLMEDVALSRAAKRVARPHCLRARLGTSGRRWERHGVARTILLMWRLRFAYFLGADPANLAARYGRGR
jgi:rSAM/selenodomain-associated transferase 2